MVYLRWYKLWRFVSILGLTIQLWLVMVAGDVNERFAEIEIESGDIRGKRNVTLFDEKPYYSFRGIPYGQSPIDELRFKAPKKVAPWIDTFDAFEYGNDCIQIDFQTDEFFGAEDCLNLNVFVPSDAIESKDSTNKSVMIFIQGEAFQSGSARHFAPDFLLEKDVIVVTFNYRLGAIGHMSLNLPDYSGNMAFKDQVLVLNWINQNIDKFGGNPNNVTLFGHGSGAISVSLHTISPLSKGLFQSAIMLSGSALNPSIPRVKDHLTILYNLAENLHYPVDNNRDLIEFLKQIDGMTLTKRTYQDFSNTGFGRRMANLIWSAVVEHPHAPEPFISKTPFDILTDDNYKSNINSLFSCTFEEMYGEFIDELQNPSLLKSFDEIFELQLPLRNAKLKFHAKEYKEMSMKVRDLYFKGNRVDNNTITGFYTLMTDVWFLYGIDLNARIQANKSTGFTYFSTFSVKSPWNLSTRKGKQHSFNYNFSHHFDQVPYIFRYGGRSLFEDTAYTDLSKDSFERNMIDTINKFYTNFAKFGNPLPNVDPILFKANQSQDNYNYIDITNNGLVAKTNPNRERIEFWNDIFNEYSQHWQTREFNMNSLAIKLPLLALALLLFSILCCKGINMCLRRDRKSISVHHN